MGYKQEGGCTPDVHDIRFFSWVGFFFVSSAAEERFSNGNCRKEKVSKEKASNCDSASRGAFL